MALNYAVEPQGNRSDQHHSATTSVALIIEADKLGQSQFLQV